VGNLDVVRDFTDVRDVVRAYWALLDRGATGALARPATVYNVCSGRGVRLGDVLARLIELAGVNVEVRQDPARFRPADIPVLVGDPSRLRAATGWEPRIALESTLRDLLEDWRARTASPVRSGR